MKIKKDTALSIKKFLYESLNLSAKLFGIYLIIALVLTFWISSYTESLLKSHLQQQLEESGKTVSKNIADISVNYLLTENVHGMNKLLNEQMEANKNIEYIMVFDWKSDLFSHTLPGQPSSDLLQMSNDEIQVIKTEGGYIWDFSAAITNYQVGIVRVGISETRQLSIVKTIITNILFSLIIFFVVSAIIVSALHRILTQPITELVKGTKLLSKGDFKYRVPAQDRNDEMGVLINSFNLMIDDLESYKNKADELDKKRKLLLEKVINIQEEERKFLSMELHDEIGQSLTGVKLNLKSLEGLVEDKVVKDKVINLHSQVVGSLTTIHNLIVEIGPRFLEGKSIETVFERYVKDYEERYNINISLEVEILSSLKLVSQAKSSIFRIMQESLTNIAKYAKASEVFITLQSSKNHLLLIVEDNGIGFDVQNELNQMSTNKNMGLFGMQERATLFGGTLLIESEKGVGTTIFARIPIIEVVAGD